MNIMLGCDMVFCYNVYMRKTQFTRFRGIWAINICSIHKMIKRISALILIISMVVIVSACAGNRDIGQDNVKPEWEPTGQTDMTGGEMTGEDNAEPEGEPTGHTSMSGGEMTDEDNVELEGEPTGQTDMIGEEIADEDNALIDDHTAKNEEDSETAAELVTPEDETEPVTPEDGAEPVTPENGAEPVTPEDRAEPVTPEDRAEPVLEPEGAEENEAESRALEGRIICIDPGHQTRGNYDTEPVAPGSDEMKAKVSSGTAGVKTKVPEYKLVLEVALGLRDALEKHGATVIMTRTENNVDISNAQRATMANDADADLYFRIHADGSTDKSVHGASVLIPGNGYITDEYVLKESERAGRCILDSFVKATGAKRRGLVKRNDLSGFNWCSVPMALIEIGFMSNAEEDVKLNTTEYQDKMIKGMANGIVEYFTSN